MSIPLTRRLIVLGYLLEDAAPQVRPTQHRHETTRLRGALRDRGPGAPARENWPAIPAPPPLTVNQSRRNREI